jgi:hypothetical protein
LQGTFRADRHAERLLEPVSEGAPVPPPDLTKREKGIWDRYAEQAPWITVGDSGELAALCQAEAEIQLKRKSRQPVPVMLQKFAQSCRIQLGMTPAGRSKVRAEKAAPKTKLERFTGGA